MQIIECDEATHAAAIRTIFNDAILNTTALYEYAPRSEAVIAAWFATRRQNGAPVLGAVDDNGQLLGFASYGPFRPFPAFKYTIEHSVYVHPAHRGRGVARALMQALIGHAREAGMHVMVGGIDSANAASIALHESLGFSHAGTIAESGYKFGRWLDLAFYQLRFGTPLQPVGA